MLDIFLILGLIPVRVKLLSNSRNSREFLQRIKVNPAKHNTYSLLALFFMLIEILLEHGDTPTFWRHHVENSFYGCTFPRPIFTNQPHNAVRRKGKADIFQSKSWIVLIDTLDAQYCFHYFFSYPSGVSAIFKAVLNS